MNNIYTPEEIAEILKVEPDTIRRYLRDGKLKGFKVGNHWRIKEEDLQEFIENQYK